MRPHLANKMLLGILGLLLCGSVASWAQTPTKQATNTLRIPTKRPIRTLVLPKTMQPTKRILQTSEQQLANRWLVITGTAGTLAGAKKKRNQSKTSGSILATTHFKGLSPGWFVIVFRGYAQKSAALDASNILNAKGISNYVKFSGEYLPLRKGTYRLQSLNRKLARRYFRQCTTFQSYTSPNRRTKALFDEGDMEGRNLTFLHGDQKRPFKAFAFNPSHPRWSRDSRWLGFVHVDQYAGSGDEFITLIHTQQLHHVKLRFFPLFKHRKFGGRSMYKVVRSCWSPRPRRYLFTLHVNFLGSSGHPGIDINRKSELGRNFGKNSPRSVGSFAVYLRPGS